MVKYRYNPTIDNQTIWDEDELPIDEHDKKNILQKFLKNYGELFKDFFKRKEAQQALKDNNFESLFQYWEDESVHVADTLIHFLYLTGVNFEDYIEYERIKNWFTLLPDAVLEVIDNDD